MSIKAIKAAKKLYAQYDLTVPVDMSKLFEDLGIKLVVQPMQSVSGFAYKEDGQMVIGVNRTDGYNRRRFTAAHELGHMFLQEAERIVYDEKHSFVYFRDINSSTGIDAHEIEANAFAAELLMPSDVLRQRLKDMDGVDLEQDDEKIAKLANEFKVSFSAMSIRIGSLSQAMGNA